MKKTISPLLGIGLLICAIYMVVEIFITTISIWIAIPVLVVAIVLLLIGGFKKKVKK